MTEPVSIPWVNDGRAFVVRKDDITPRMQKEAMVAYHAAKRRGLEGTATMHESLVREIVAEAEATASLEAGMVVVARLIQQHDARLASKSVDEIMERLDTKQTASLIKALGLLDAADDAGHEGPLAEASTTT